MRKYLNASDKINSIRLELRHPSTKNIKWVLVEGEDDIKLYGKLLNDSLVSVEQVHGGIENLRTAVSTLVNETKQVLGIRDADFLNLNSSIEKIESLFVTDFHDTEMLMVNSDNTMNAIFNEFLNGHTDYNEVRSQIMESISFLGGIRWFNDTYNLELNFKGISLQNSFSPDPISFDKTVIISEINQRSPKKQRVITQREIEEFLPAKLDLYNLCNGHDFEKAFASYITKHSNSGVKPKEIGKSLRLSYNIVDFRETKLFESLCEWGANYTLALFDY